MRSLGHRLRFLAARDDLWLDTDDQGHPVPRSKTPQWATAAEVGSVLRQCADQLESFLLHGDNLSFYD